MKTILLSLTLLLGATITILAQSIEEIAEREEVDNEAVQVYGGKVGKLPAVFFIEWAGTEVSGQYYHPARGKNKRYQLEGKNPKQGVLVLKEYTPVAGGSKKYTATIHLSKKVKGGKIIWSGTMHNADGRKLPVSFSRKTSKK